MNNYSIGLRIRELRLLNGMSQLQLALSAEITPAYLSQLERDEKSPTVKCLSGICNGLHLSLNEFFDTKNDIKLKPYTNQIIEEINSFDEKEQKELLQIIRHISHIKRS